MPCQAVRERDFTLVSDVALDLSPDGMLLRTKGRALTGDPMIVSFFEPEAARWFDLDATVARVVHARRTGDQERCIAVSFESLDPSSRETLANALSVRPEAPSAPLLRGLRPGAPIVSDDHQ